MTLQAVEQTGGPQTLGDFVAGLHSAPVNEALIERIRSAYASVLPMQIADEDLATFLTVLYAAVRYWRPRTVVQTGTFVGASAIAIALGLARNRTGELYTIDPEPPEYFGVREPVAIARRVIESAGLASRVHLVKGYSTVPLDAERMALPTAPLWCLTRLPCDGRYDMVVVDGDHTFDGCLLDLDHGITGLAPDGARVVVVHDYLGIDDVRHAVRSWCASHEGWELRVVPSPCGIALLQVRSDEIEQTNRKEVGRWNLLRQR